MNNQPQPIHIYIKWEYKHIKPTNFYICINIYRSRKVNIPLHGDNTWDAMYSFDSPVQDLQVFDPKKRKQRRIYLHIIPCSIGKEKTEPNSHLRCTAKGKKAKETSYSKGASD